MSKSKKNNLGGLVMDSFIPFISFIIIAAYTPGPNNIMSMINAGKVGLKKAWVFNLGIVIGFSILMIVCGLFTNLMGHLLPTIKPFLKYIGAIYILYLAYTTYNNSYNFENGNENIKSYSLKSGILLQFVNPKAILFGITTLSTFVLPYYEDVYVLLFALILAVNTFFATMTWALFGSFFHDLLLAKTKLVNSVMTLALIFTAISQVV